jgi:phosphoribosylformimino-5-aminoimidazole carboxamide ribonucleotide (ProFAR) isomerase
MIVYPAIDLRDGTCVRLMHGRFDQVTEYDESPMRRLASFVRDGATWVHIVDLDGAQAGHAVQHTLIAELAASFDVAIQSGGGVRSDQRRHPPAARGRIAHRRRLAGGDEGRRRSPAGWSGSAPNS